MSHLREGKARWLEQREWREGAGGEGAACGLWIWFYSGALLGGDGSE